MGKEHPIPIIPERAKPSEEEEGKEKRKVKIEVSEGVTKTFIEFAGGTPEDLIKLISCCPFCFVDRAGPKRTIVFLQIFALLHFSFVDILL